MENGVSERVIACAFEVSNRLGAGFFESVYENALAIEFDRRGVGYERQKRLAVTYRDQIVGEYIADLVVEESLVIEVKALSYTTPVHEAQVMNYLRATGLTAGLLINFDKPRVGIRRLVNAHDDRRPI